LWVVGFALRPSPTLVKSRAGLVRLTILLL
jgi:hypothetical protein